MTTGEFHARYAAVLKQIADAAAKAGRKPETIKLLAVSKAQPAAAIRALHDLGQNEFGENYAQELAAKAEELRSPKLRFVFIGALQSNKLGVVARWAGAVQSLGSERHARLLARHVQELGKAPYPVHLLVNAGDEATKHGLAMHQAEPLARLIAAELPELAVQGVMAIPPPLAAGVTTPPELYLRLRALADVIGAGELSLGMSGDLGVAIAAGSDCVRVGTALFGSRPAANSL